MARSKSPLPADTVATVSNANGDLAGSVQVLSEMASVAPALASPQRFAQVDMRRYHPALDPQLALFEVIRRSTERIGFNRYTDFVRQVFSSKSVKGDIVEAAQAAGNWPNPVQPTGVTGYGGTRAYLALKEATDVFLQSQCGVWPTDGSGFPVDPLGTEADPTVARKRTQMFRHDERIFGDGQDEPQSTKESASQRLERDASEFSDEKFESMWSKYIRFREGGVNSQTPYINLILRKLSGIPIRQETLGSGPDCYGVLDTKLKNPCLIELIWSYWMEQGMVVQSINALAMRFQNRRTADVDVLARFDVDPLRPLNNLLWGYIQDEHNRLTLVRRAYEYDHHYGLKLQGRAIPPLQPADSRPRFLESFHNLLRECSRYYKAITNTFIVPDTYPALNCLRELQIILTEGMHNQYGDLPSTSRAEILMQQWLMGRPEMLQFVGQRVMVPHPENWMGYVDTIRQVHGWGDTNVRHFRDLAVFGERILLAVRFGNWAVNYNDISAALFMSFFREDIQTYIHAYRAVTGVDLSMEDMQAHDPRVFTTQPSELLMARLPSAKAAMVSGRDRLLVASRGRPLPGALNLPTAISPANPPMS
ncbi:MAG: hypothetical protein H7210_08110 [Pyrinomonadaceae bacterium]|nr:hypothetical protein [Phycisphaerales bacterium]